MDRYGVRDVERLLRLPRSTIRSLVNAGFVSPERGPRNSWRFSFEDLVVLRKAQALVEANVPQRQITRAIRELRRQAEAGQYPLEFGEVVPTALGPLPLPGGDKPAAPAGDSLAELIDRGYELHEAGRLPEAEAVYREARRAHGADAMLLVNLGVLLEDMKRKAEAILAYESAIAAQENFADAHYNLALLLDSSGRRRDAIRHMARYRELMRA
jgi:tetratricopeptide (TPR) repeat protein